jgi:hypothetical protein
MYINKYNHYQGDFPGVKTWKIALVIKIKIDQQKMIGRKKKEKKKSKEK